jgi:hypothetical protein
VSNKQGGLHGSSIANGGVGYCCLAEVRMYETIEHGAPKTPFLRFGDSVRIEMLDAAARASSARSTRKSRTITGGKNEALHVFRSSAAYRVRIALNLKGLQYEAVPVHLLQTAAAAAGGTTARSIRAAWCRPLQDDYITLTQSMAILEYLDETHPDVPLLPADPPGRARVRELAQIIACDIHPLNNLRVLRYLVHSSA